MTAPPEAPEIRRARPEDGPRVAALWLALLDEQSRLDDRFAPAADARTRWAADWPERVRDDGRRILVAERGEALVGFVTAARWWPAPVYAGGGEVYVDELYVEPGARGEGVGTRLVEAVRAWSEASGAVRLRLGLLAANGDGRRFWARQGARAFTETHTIDLAPQASEAVKDRRIGF